MYKCIVLLLFSALGSTAAAQTFTIEYESPLGHQLALKGPDLVNWRNRFDYNDDGTPELVTMRYDDQDNLVEMVVFDVATGQQVKTHPYFAIVDVLEGQVPTRFLGFFRFYEQGNKASAFMGEGVLGLLDGDVGKNSAAAAFTLPAEAALIFDIDNDSQPEIIIQNPDTRTVQVWGSGDTGTATEEDIAAALLRLFQSYPNPFRTSTTITYDVEQPGPVTVTVYDALGRTVKTLIDGQQAVGSHEVVWDGRDAGGRAVASGTYFYRLRVGGAVTSKQTIRVK